MTRIWKDPMTNYEKGWQGWMSTVVIAVLAAVVALLFFVSTSLDAQEALCPVDITATGGDRWQVLVSDSGPADSLVSEHSTYYGAAEVAMRWETEDPTRSVDVAHRAFHRYECPEDWTLPTGGVDTVTLVDTIAGDTVWLPATDTLRSPFPVEAIGDSAGVTVTWNDLAGDAEQFHFRAGMDGVSWSVWDTVPGTVGSHTVTPPVADTARSGWVCITGLRGGVEGRRSCDSWQIPAQLALDSIRLWPDSLAFTFDVDTATSDTTWSYRAYEALADSMVLADQGAGRQFQFTAVLFAGDSVYGCAGAAALPECGGATHLTMGSLLRRFDP